MAVAYLPHSTESVDQSSAPSQNGRYPESLYIRYLPVIYQQDMFLRRFMLIFESVLRPMEAAVENLPAYTDAGLTPDEFLPWLSQWLALALDSNWPLERQRAMIAHAVEVYRWRGTKRGLRLHIECYTGTKPLIQEYSSGFVLGRESALGWTTQLVASKANPLLFVVTVPVIDPKLVDPQVLRTIIEEDKPAHTTYRLHLVRRRVGSSPARPKA